MLELREKGQFSFPSQRLPPLAHVWKLPGWLQCGNERIRASFLSWLGFSIDQLLVQIPIRFRSQPQHMGYFQRESRSPLCLALACKAMMRSALRLMDLLIGLPVFGSRTNENELMEQYILQERGYIVREAGAEVDIRLYENQQLRKWYERLLRRPEMQHLNSLLDPVGDENDEDSYVHNENNPEQLLSLPRQLIHDSVLLRDEDATAITEEALDGQAALNEVMKRIPAVLAEREELVRSAVREKAPRRSLGSSWLTHTTAHAMQHVIRQNGGDAIQRGNDENAYQSSATIAELREEVVQEFERRGFANEAALERLRIRFLYEQWPAAERQLLADEIPSVTFTKHVNYVNGRWVHREVEYPKSYIGWRLVAIARDSWSRVRKWVAQLLILNMRDGPLGVRALFSAHDFDVVHGNNSSHSRNTFLSRLRAIWKDVVMKRRGFEMAEDKGFMSKSATRWLHKLWVYVFRGALSTALVALGQPVLTFANVAVSSCLLITAPFWGMLTGVSSVVISCVFCDLYMDSTNSQRYTVRSYDVLPTVRWNRRYICSGDENALFPVVVEALRFSVLGVGQAVCAAIGAFIVHPTLALSASGLASTRSLLQRLVDAVMQFLIYKFGRLPASDSFLARRIAGPGISSTYYYRLAQGLTERCVRAMLENVELDIIRETLISVISEPEEAFRQYVKDTTLHVLGSDYTGDLDIHVASFMRVSPQSRRLCSRGNEFRRRVINEIKSRKKLLEPLLCMPVDRDRIRPEQAPEETLAQVTVQVEDFYEKRLRGLHDGSSDGSPSIWKRFHTTRGDFQALSRELLRNMFCDDFLTPLNQSDQVLHIEATFDGVLNIPGVKEELSYQREQETHM